MDNRKRVKVCAGLLGAALLTVTSVAPAATQFFQAPVQSVYPQGDGSFIVIFAQSSPSCSSQNNPQYFFVAAGQFGVNADGVKGMLATALTAFSLNRSLSIAFDDSTPNRYINRLAVQP